jgi:hypothetical protein
MPQVAESEVREIFPAMRVSWAVFDPWSFWNAWRIESVEVTVPDPATNPVRREVRFNLPEKVLKSVSERAPVVVLLASPIERPVPTRESQLVGVRIERAPCLLLNVVQSVPVSTPVEEDDAFQIENTPVALLYASGHTAERDASPILALNVFQSVDESAPVVVVLASPRDRPVPMRESQFAGVEMNPILLLKRI